MLMLIVMAMYGFPSLMSRLGQTLPSRAVSLEAMSRCRGIICGIQTSLTPHTE